MLLGTRIRLRRLERSDLPRCAAWLNDPEVRVHLAAIYPLSQTHEEQWYEATLALEPALQPFAIDALSTEATASEGLFVHIGVMGLHALDWRNRSAELGIVIGDKTRWSGGYGCDAIHTFTGWCFRELNLNRVWLRVYEDNARAVRCYEKAGFRHEGRLRQDRFHAGRYWDTLVMGLLREERG